MSTELGRAPAATVSEDREEQSGSQPVPRWRRPRVQALIVLATVVVAALAVKVFGRNYTFYDVKIYHGAVTWWLDGGPLYEFIQPGTNLGFTYPPFAAVVMLPMAGMSAIAAGWVNAVLSVVALTVVLAVLLFPIADRLGWPRGLVLGMAVPLALALEPGRETIGFGQVNLLLFGLILADLVALRWRAGAVRAARSAAAPAPVSARAFGAGDGSWTDTLRRLWWSGSWAGVGIGLATAVKVTPGLFIVYLLVSRQWRAAFTAIGTAGAATLAAAVAAPRESLSYFTHVLWQTERVGAADFTPNQSLAGLLARLYDQTHAPTLLWLSFAAVCAVLGLSRAVSAHREGDELAAFTLVGLTAVVLSPISWSHHLVFVITAVIIMGDVALRRWATGRAMTSGPRLTGAGWALAAAATYLLFLISPLWWVHHRLPEGSHYDSGLWGVLAENSLALGVILLLAVLPWRPGAEPALPAARSRRVALGYRAVARQSA